jgi:hypothetical protein
MISFDMGTRFGTLDAIIRDEHIGHHHLLVAIDGDSQPRPALF